MKKSVLTVILCVILVAGFVGLYFVVSIIDLTNKNDVQDVEIVYAYDFLEIEHSINGLIPIGTDYYYLGVTEDDEAYIIKDSKNWLVKNFDADGVPNEGTYKLHGLAKPVSDYDVKQELAIRMSQIQEYVTPMLEYGVVVNPKYVRESVTKIVVGIILLIEAAIAFIFRGNYDKLNPMVKKVLILVFLITIIVGLRCII